jgi:hypothetical protein
MIGEFDNDPISKINSIKSVPGHFKFRYKYKSQNSSNASNNNQNTSGANLGQRFDAELNVVLTTNVPHKIFIALVAYYTRKYVEVPNPSETTDKKCQKPNRKSTTSNDLIKSTQAKKFLGTKDLRKI